MRKITGRWEKPRGLDYRTDNKITCSLEGGCGSEESEKEDYSGISKMYSPGVHKNYGQGWLKAKIKLSVQKLYARGMTTQHHLPS